MKIEVTTTKSYDAVFDLAPHKIELTHDDSSSWVTLFQGDDCIEFPVGSMQEFADVVQQFANAVVPKEEVLIWDTRPDFLGYVRKGAFGRTFFIEKAERYSLSASLFDFQRLADLGGWILHDTKSCPVPADLFVDVILENGDVLEGERAERWSWDIFPIEYYRPSQQWK